jgi:hypothetical protein
MANSKNILHNALWLLLATIAPVAIVTLSVFKTQNDRQYFVGVALAEIVGVFCLTRLHSKLWIRLVCIAIYVPASWEFFYFYTMCLVLGWPWRGPHC